MAMVAAEPPSKARRRRRDRARALPEGVEEYKSAFGGEDDDEYGDDSEDADASDARAADDDEGGDALDDDRCEIVSIDLDEACEQIDPDDALGSAKHGNKVTGLSEDMLDCLLLCSCDAAMAYPEDTPDKYEWEGEPARADETHDKYLWQQTLSCSGDLLVFCTNEIGV
jgi:hypothetical protein